MPFATGLVGEQAEKEKYVTGTHTHILQMRLRPTTLPKKALIADKHRIFMAEVISLNPPSRNLLYKTT
jgi:hypothetical protein